MNYRKSPLDAGLYLVATPIGNARDITLRALDILASADAIAAEDTRTARKLMEIHGVPLEGRRILAYHDHSPAAMRDKIAGMVADGASVAYVSEAGTPLISDPGFGLGQALQARDLPVTAAPGASAAVAALTIGGLPTDRFLFLGFPPSSAAQRKALWAELGSVPATLVLYESPRRVRELFAELREILGETRQARLCREITKRFEEVLSGTLAELCAQLETQEIKGECVILIDRPHEAQHSEQDVEAALKEALQTMRIKDAATTVAGAFGLPRRDVYALALKMSR